MALLWCDGFDHYGVDAAGRAAMLDGVYAEISSSPAAVPSTANPRTGTRALRINNGTGGRVRRVFGADKSVVGVGYALYLPALPQQNRLFYLADFRDNANTAQSFIGITTTGQVEAYSGNDISGTVIGTSAPVIVSGAYQHVEVRVDIDSSAGAYEVRVNGVTVLDISNVNTRSGGAAQTAQVRIGKTSGANWSADGQPIYIDDLYAWDDQGGVVDDFIGDQRVWLLAPDQDTAETDWVRNTGANDFEAIDEDTPDDDTSYVAASTPAGSPPVGEVSVFGLADLPAAVASVTAVQMFGRLRKTDAGACDVQMSMVSDDVGSPPAPAEANGADRPITEVYTYWGDVIHNDPATGAPWTPSAVNGAEFKVERTA